MPAGKITYQLDVDYQKGVASFGEAGKAINKLGSNAVATGQKATKAIDKIGLKVMSLNQLLELGQKAFRLFSLPLDRLIEIGSKFENLQERLEITFRSASKGREAFDWLKEFSSRTPFQIEGLTESFILLENFGINGRKYLQTFGDAAAGLKIPMKDLSMVMGQIWTKPTAQAEEMLQLMERGIPVTRILGEEMGLTAEQVGNIGKYGIKGEKVFEALAEGMKKYYGGAMEAMSKTWEGLTSTLKDKVILGLSKVAMPVLENLKDKVNYILAQLDKWAADGTLNKVAESIAGFITGAIDTISNVIKLVWEWRGAIIFVGKAWLLYFSVSKIRAWQKGITEGFAGFAGSLREVHPLLARLSVGFLRARRDGGGFFSSIGAAIKRANVPLKGMGGVLGKIGPAAAAAFGGWQIGRLIGQVTGLDKKMVEFFDVLIDKSVEYYETQFKLRNMDADQRASQKRREQVLAIAKSYGIMETNIKQVYLALYQNKEAYAKLDPVSRQYVDRMWEKQQALEKVQKAHKAKNKVTGESVKIDQEYLELMQKYGLKLEAAQKLYEKLNPEMAGVLKIQKELNVSRERADQIYNDLYQKQAADYAQKQALIIEQNKFSGQIMLTNEQLAQNAQVAGWVTQALNTQKKAVIDTEKELEILGGKMLAVAQVGAQVIDILSGLGLIGEKTAARLSGITDGIGGIAGGLDQIAKGKAAGGFVGFLGQVGGYASVAAAGISILSNVIGGLFDLLTGDGVQETIDRENGWMQLTEEMNEKLHELAEQIGDTHAATSLMLSDIMQQSDINRANFGQWADRLREVLIDMDNGYLSTAQAAQEIGKGWNYLIEQSRKLGVEGSAQMVETIRNLRSRGMEVAEVSQYINEQLAGALQGLGGYIAGAADIAGKIAEAEKRMADMRPGGREWQEANAELLLLKENLADTMPAEKFARALTYAEGMMASLSAEGKSMIEIVDMMGPQLDSLLTIAEAGGYDISPLSELLGLREFVEANREVMTGIDASTKMLQGFGNTGYLTADLFQGFQQDALDYFNQITKDGKNQQEAYMALMPYLSQLKWYAEQNNLQLDEHTRKLIADAEAAGVNLDGMKSQQQLQQEMNQSLTDLVYIMSTFTGVTVQSTEALQNMAASAGAAFDRSEKGVNKLIDSLRGLGGVDVGGFNINVLDAGSQAAEITARVPGFASGTDGDILRFEKPTLVALAEKEPEDFWAQPVSKSNRMPSFFQPASRPSTQPASQQKVEKHVTIHVNDNRRYDIQVTNTGGEPMDEEKLAVHMVNVAKDDKKSFITKVVKIVKEELN